MNENRLTDTEVEKLQEANNLMAIPDDPARVKRARQLIGEVLASAAPMFTDSEGHKVSRTPPYWNEDDEGWD